MSALSLPTACNALAQADNGRDTVGLARSLFDDPDAPVIGNPQGRDTIIEFFDYRCPYCRALQPELMRLLAEDPEARVILKEWPAFGGISIYAARVALAANWQGKFGAVHDSLLESHGPLDRARVRQIAEGAGADLARLDRDMDVRGAELDRMLRHVQAQAEMLHLKGTPGLVVGRRVIFGALSLDDLKSLITEAHDEAASDAPPVDIDAR